jgi:FlaA1/EpsC-like NDP-sugar epimerase
MNNTLFKADFIPFYKDKTILITGSVGTVGSELLKQIAAYKPAEIRLFDNQESGLFMQMQACRNGAKAIPILGDIRDSGKIHSVMEGVDVVFHLAAFKHVLLCEQNPFDSVRTNVIGTQNVLTAAIAKKVKRLLYTSSDKAVNPTNVMGTSKLLAERVVTASSIPCFNGSNGQIFSSTRFGNVLGSNGSVVPVFAEQIKRGGPVTITDVRMTRFVMTIQEATRLVIKGAALAYGGEVFVTKMPVIKIVDLAMAMIELLAPLYGYRPENFPVEYTGAKPGEKLYEELMSEDETARAIELEDMFSVLPALIDANKASRYLYPGVVSNKVSKAYISRDEKMMIKEEVINYLLANSILGEELTKSINRDRKIRTDLKPRYNKEIVI